VPRSFGTASRQIIMRNARNVRGEIRGINSPNAQLAGSMNFSKMDLSFWDGAYRAPECRLESERDNIIKVTILMGALLKRVNYSRTIIAGNALYFERTLRDFSRYAQKKNFRPTISPNVKVSQQKLRVQSCFNFRNHITTFFVMQTLMQTLIRH